MSKESDSTISQCCSDPTICYPHLDPNVFCPGPPVCNVIHHVQSVGVCPGPDVCLVPSDFSCPGPDVCLASSDSDFCPGPDICLADIRSSASSAQIADTIHYLSLASSRVCECEEPECVCEEEVSFRFTEISSELEAQFLEKTLAIIQPDGVKYEHVVLRKIRLAGFKIIQKRVLHLSPEQASEFYKSHYGKVYFPYFVVSLSEAPIIVLCLAAVDAVNKFQELIGVNGTIQSKWFFHKCLRHRFGIQPNIENVLYGSPDLKTAYKDIRFFFPQMILEPLLCEEMELTNYLQLNINQTLSKGLAEIIKVKPLEPIIALAEWLLQNNPNQPKMQPRIMKLPT